MKYQIAMGIPQQQKHITMKLKMIPTTLFSSFVHLLLDVEHVSG